MPTVRELRNAMHRAAVRSHVRAASPPHASQEDLTRWAREHLAGLQVVIASNREPYSHHHGDEGITWTRNAGGLTVALDAVARAIGATWVAHGHTAADREVVDAADRVPCPPGRSDYTLRRLWLTDEDHERYYSGFANGALWPLCHIAYVRPRFEAQDWERYRDVNERFARAVLAEIDRGPALVLLQDYHLALAAKTIREARPDVRLALFWHIPWPNGEVVRRLPWREELLDGLLANDLLGFHIAHHAQNFVQTVADSLEARIEHEHQTVVRAGRRTEVRAFPIGADADEISRMATSAETTRRIAEWRQTLGLEDARIGLGVDRMDYTKGVPERLEALEVFYERHPDAVRWFRWVQVAVPSRIELEEYQAVARRVREIAARIQSRFAPAGPTLVHVLEENLDFRALVPLYAMADLCAVTSLHDGMNLVAKEYVAACTDLQGSLVLSPFTGAARELTRAWIATPFDREAMVAAYEAALGEPEAERRERMRDLREAVLRRTVFDWAIELLTGALSVRTTDHEPVAPDPVSRPAVRASARPRGGRR